MDREGERGAWSASRDRERAKGTSWRNCCSDGISPQFARSQFVNVNGKAARHLITNFWILFAKINIPRARCMHFVSVSLIHGRNSQVYASAEMRYHFNCYSVGWCAPRDPHRTFIRICITSFISFKSERCAHSSASGVIFIFVSQPASQLDHVDRDGSHMHRFAHGCATHPQLCSMWKWMKLAITNQPPWR